MANSDHTPPGTLTRTFARKVRLSTWALFFERLWPRLWLLLALAALLAVLSLSGVFLTLSQPVHAAIIGAFGLAAVAAAVYAIRAPWPTREEAIRRIERRSGVPHRPATSYEDTLTANTDNEATQTLWQAHRERLARAMARLRVGNPSPRADRFDPFALRVLPLLLLVPAVGLVSGSIYERLTSAFRLSSGAERVDTRVDAWVTPPAYTGKPPIMLADGSQEAAADEAKGKDDGGKPKLFEVPIKSTVTLRGSGFKGAPISFEVTEAGGEKPVVATADAPKDKIDVAEVRFELKNSARVTARAGNREVGHWTFDVIPDQIPKITLNKDWRRTAKGSLKLSYKGEDDYGIASAVAKVRQLKDKPDADRSKAWARPEPVKGPRLPLERPPEIALKLPHAGATSFESTSMHDLGKHPWAGQTVELWLEATDVAGQIGRSEKLEVVLPMRFFRKPLARAVMEQRRKLAEDSRNRPTVVRALDALTLEPEGFIEKPGIYLGLRSVYHRIERENSREAIASAVDQLWDVAVNIEDGTLSNAEKDLKDARDRLSKALQEGASEEEIKQLMQELKEAMNKYLQEMQKNAQDGDQQDGDKAERQVNEQDMEQMLKDLEDSAKNGSREEAERLLAEMQEMMENARPQTAQEKAEQDKANDMLKKLDALSDLSGKQQKLMDETFSEQRQQEGQQQERSGQQKGQQRGQQRQPGGKQQQQQGAQGQAQQGSEQQGQRQQRSNDQSGAQAQNDGKGSGLKDRQSQLRKKLEQIQKELDEMGAGGSDRLKQAESAMKSAEESLEKGDMEEAGQSQSDALDQMRQSAQQMAEKMQKDGKNRGRNADGRRDPLDRPQRAEGPDIGNSVKVPNAIDAQRAREILDELRKRSGQALRPPTELDYIDRLLKRF